MKSVSALRLLLTFLLLCAGRESWSLCLPGGFTLWPATATISPNPVFLVEGYMYCEGVIAGLGVGHPVYLTSGRDTVRLALRIYQGQYNQSQALLKPVKPLVAGRTYTLHIDRLEGYCQEEFASQKRSWMVIPQADLRKPAWKAKPAYHSKSLIQYGCGPAKYVNFCLCIEDESPVLVLARVKNLETGSMNECFVIPPAVGLSLGHGMCTGEFDFKEGYNYEASFALLDAGGNQSAIYTEPVPFRTPLATGAAPADLQIAPNSCTCKPVGSLKAALLNWQNEPYLLLSGFILVLVLAGVPLWLSKAH
jgi:hypothetical protein